MFHTLRARTMSVQSDRFRGQMPALLEAVCIMLGSEGKGQLLKPLTQMPQSPHKFFDQVETKGQALSNMRFQRNTSATPLQLHNELHAHLDRPNPHMIVRTNICKCALPKHANLSRSCSICCPCKIVLCHFH